MEETHILPNTCVESEVTLNESFQRNFDHTYIITDLSNSNQRLVSIPSGDVYHSNLLNQNKPSFVDNSQEHVYEVPIVNNDITVLNNYEPNFIDPKEISNPITTDNTSNVSLADTPAVASHEQYVTSLPETNSIPNKIEVQNLKSDEEIPETNVQPASKIQKKVFKLSFPIPKGLKKIKNLIAVYHCKLCGFLSKSKELMDEHRKSHKIPIETKPPVKKPRRKRRTKKEMAMKKERKIKKEKGIKKENDTDQGIKKEKGVKKEKSENEPKKKRGPRKPQEDIIMKDGNVYCPQCSFFTKTLQSLKVHRLMHNKERPYKCTVCDYHGKDLKDLIKHHDGGHMPGVFVCKDCGYLTNERSRFDSHRETHTGHLPYRCKVCPYKTMLKAAHKIHMETHGIEV